MAANGRPPANASGAPEYPPDQLDSLAMVLGLVRTAAMTTRAELGERTGLGRTAIAQRLSQLQESGLVEEGGLASSTGGRAPRQVRFCSNAGHLLVADLTTRHLRVGLTNLSGVLISHHEEESDVVAGPDSVLGRVDELFAKFLRERSSDAPPIWGVGIGVPGPVEFATGCPVAPPIMPGWDDYPIADHFTRQYRVPTWVDNDVNLMALGELRSGLATRTPDVVVIKLGSGIGAGLISGGRLHRGAQGAAGDVGHVAVIEDSTALCRCGNVGCLEALAGGLALAQQATQAAIEGRSDILAQTLDKEGKVDARHVSIAANHGDPIAVRLLNGAGELVGRMLATLVNFYNPSLVIIGGGLASAGDLLLASIRQTVYKRSLPLATRNLEIKRSELGIHAGLIGAASLVVDELFSPFFLAQWLHAGTPASITGASMERRSPARSKVQ